MALFPVAMPLNGVAAADAPPLDEDSFRLFYERTARPLRGYLCKLLNDSSKADDLLQESYLRLLEAKTAPDMTDEHRKNYLFRIATNLMRDEVSRRRPEPLGDYASATRLAHDVGQRTDMRQFLAQLTPRESELLWLAYVERFNHQEIAAVVGAKTPSIRPMLARARVKLSEMLKAGGFSSEESR